MSYEYRCCSREIGFRIEVERFLAKDMEVWGWQLNLRLFEAATSNPSSNFIFFFIIIIIFNFSRSGWEFAIECFGCGQKQNRKIIQ